jgi:hypothetical protein
MCHYGDLLNSFRENSPERYVHLTEHVSETCVGVAVELQPSKAASVHLPLYSKKTDPETYLKTASVA